MKERKKRGIKRKKKGKRERIKTRSEGKGEGMKNTMMVDCRVQLHTRDSLTSCEHRFNINFQKNATELYIIFLLLVIIFCQCLYVKSKSLFRSYFA